jgi:HAD superfamily hydrolase (TIGR01509 family)
VHQRSRIVEGVIMSSAGPAPITGVIFDFHATLVDTRDAGAWIEAAREHLGRPADGLLEPGSPAFTGLSDHLHRVWEHAATFDPNSERDLSSARHQEVFRRAVALRPGVDPDLIEALYAVMPQQWVAYDDTRPVLQELSSRGIRIVVLSNAGIDVRPTLDRAGLTGFIDGVVVSYQVGVVKPDPAIFRLALDTLGRPADQALMVGDSGRDDVGGTALGIRTLVLPRTIGPVHGLASVLRLVGSQ